MRPEILEEFNRIKHCIDAGTIPSAYGTRTPEMFPESVLSHIREHDGLCPFCIRQDALENIRCFELIKKPGGTRWVCSRHEGHEGPCVACFPNSKNPWEHNLTLVDWPDEFSFVELPLLPEPSLQPLEI